MSMTLIYTLTNLSLTHALIGIKLTNGLQRPCAAPRGDRCWHPRSQETSDSGNNHDTLRYSRCGRNQS
jgi:hypothetical protein